VLALYREPAMPGVRVDSGVTEGGEVSVHYDSLLAKLVAWGETREAARLRAREALAHYAILGIRTNVPLLMRLLTHDRFVAGDLDTHFLDTEAASLLPGDSPPSADARAVAAMVRRGGSGMTTPAADRRRTHGRRLGTPCLTPRRRSRRSAPAVSCSAATDASASRMPRRSRGPSGCSWTAK
jgi:3-methylcrotonyl-CoA carboxylase alpha subunit